MVAAGELASVEELRSIEITSKEDVLRLGLERGSEFVMLQLLALQQDLGERLAGIEGRLQEIEGGYAEGVEEGEVGVGQDDEGDDEEEWGGLGS